MAGAGGYGAASALGGFLRAWGTLHAAVGEKISLRAQALQKEKEAVAVREEGLWASMRLNEERRRLLAVQREMYGAAGVTLEGAPETVQRQTNREFALDRLMLGKNVGQAASALLADAASLRQAAKRTTQAGPLQAFASFFR